MITSRLRQHAADPGGLAPLSRTADEVPCQIGQVQPVPRAREMKVMPKRSRGMLNLPVVVIVGLSLWAVIALLLIVLEG
jgi:hypothetical protein